MMLDYLQATCWSITYILLIVYAVKNKLCGIPIIPLVLNYAWETVALFVTIFYNLNIVSLLMHGVWFLLDTMIVLLFLTQYNVQSRRKIFFSLGYILAIACFAIVYSNDQLMIASYYIDFFMAIDFVVFSLFCEIKKGWISYSIAVFKLLGDAFAWLNLFRIHWGTIIVLLFNTIYLLIILWKRTDKSPLQKRFHLTRLAVSRFHNNPMVGMTVDLAVAVEESLK